MIDKAWRRLGAVILGAALALPLAAMAQQPTQSPPAVKAFDQPARDGSEAPKSGGEKNAQEPRAPQLAPVPVEGSTAVPGWNHPPEWEGISETHQYASVPGIDTTRLIQREGREWRTLRNGAITQYGGWLIGIVFFAIMLFYFVKGAIKLKQPPTGRLIERFNGVERASHWTMAISFVLLAITGVVILWGKHIILPWLGYTGFAWLTFVGKNIHNFVGPLFLFAIVVSFLIFVRDNLVTREDWTWMARFGGMFSGKEVPSGRFNGLEKAWFWGGMTLLGLVMAATGLILEFPNLDQGRQVMQLANVIHGIAAVLFISAAFGHVYMGTIGMEGAYRAMSEGYVDEEWAREHHRLWYDDVRAGKRSEKIVTGKAVPAAGDD